MACSSCKKRDSQRSKRLTALDLTDRIEFESPSDTYNADGSINRTYSADYARWASVVPRGAEPDQFREIEGHSTVTITVMYDATLAANLKDSHRISHDDGRYFDILRIENHAPDKLVIIANDYSAVIKADGMIHDGTNYDVIARNETRKQEYTDAGLEDSLHTVCLVRISEFSPAFSALNEDVTVRGEVLRIIQIDKAERSDWLKLTLKREFD